MQFADSRWAMPLTLLLLGAVAATLIWWSWRGGAAAPAPPEPAAQPTVFVPIAVDQDDISSGVLVAQQDHPGFQFTVDGTTLVVLVRDRADGRPLDHARVWLTLAPAAFAPAAALAGATTDARGRCAIRHLAPGRYVVAAARPFSGAGGAAYALASRALTIGGAAASVSQTLDLARLPSGDRRDPPRGRARNAVMVELNGIYAETWLHDPATSVPTIRRLAARGAVATQVWADYGWPLIDDTVLATGGYPAWRLFDPWPHLVSWGQQDGIDQATWYGPAGRDGFWGQDSVFDVAHRFGLATGWLGAAARRPLHLNPAALTLLRTLGPPRNWVSALAATLARLSARREGFVLSVDLDPPPAPQGEQEPSPAAPNGRYQQTAALYDAFVGALLRQLAARRLSGTTALVLTAGEAQAGHTDAANYYGPGVTRRGTSLHVPLIVAGPGVAAGRRWRRPAPADAIAPTVTALLGLPAPAQARAVALPLLAAAR